jgi:hypothetical protein
MKRTSQYAIGIGSWDCSSGCSPQQECTTTHSLAKETEVSGKIKLRKKHILPFRWGRAAGQNLTAQPLELGGFGVWDRHHAFFPSIYRLAERATRSFPQSLWRLNAPTKLPAAPPYCQQNHGLEIEPRVSEIDRATWLFPPSCSACRQNAVLFTERSNEHLWCSAISCLSRLVLEYLPPLF